VERRFMSLTSSHSIESVTRLSCLPVEEKPKRHKFYKFFGKVGTIATTFDWFCGVIEGYERWNND
jgi:hypothetical protein